MLRYRLSESAQADVLQILGWTQEQFGQTARLRYQALIVAALRDVARQPEGPGSIARPELGPGVRSWHLRLSRLHVEKAAGAVQRPRHIVIYRPEPGLVVVGRLLHEAMELARHLQNSSAWE
jgi:toxin ParE1/3/4